VISKQDRMINPDLERFMAKRAQSQVIELPGSHAIFLSHAREVAALIEKAATAAIRSRRRAELTTTQRRGMRALVMMLRC